MTLLRRFVRAARPVVETLLAGLLLGVVGTALVTQLLVPKATPGVTAEVPQARAYMLAVLHNDVDTLTKLGPATDALGQALAFQRTVDALKAAKFSSLTYLGGYALGNGGIHIYVVEADDADGSHLIPVSLTVVQGRVVNIGGEP